MRGYQAIAGHARIIPWHSQLTPEVRTLWVLTPGTGGRAERSRVWSRDCFMFHVLANTEHCGNSDPITRQMYHIQKMYCQQTSCSHCLLCDRFLWHFADIDTADIRHHSHLEKIPPEGRDKNKDISILNRYSSDYHIMWWWVSNWYSGWGSKFTIIVFPCYILLIWIILVGSGQNFTTCKEEVPAVNVKFIIWRKIYWYFVCRVNIRDWDIRDWRQGSCFLFEIRDVRLTTTCQSEPDQNSWNKRRNKSYVHLENYVKSVDLLFCQHWALHKDCKL